MSNSLGFQTYAEIVEARREELRPSVEALFGSGRRTPDASTPDSGAPSSSAPGCGSAPAFDSKPARPTVPSPSEPQRTAPEASPAAGEFRPGGVVLEVGCGHGHFLTAYAAAHPLALCVGIDMEASRVERAERKRRRAELPHLHFIRAEAGDFLAVLPRTAALSTIFVLFPDPWPKRRHHKNRVVNADFLIALAARSTPGCRLCFRTDHLPYFNVVEALIDGRSLPDEADDDLSAAGLPAGSPPPGVSTGPTTGLRTTALSSTAPAVPSLWGRLGPSHWPFETETVFQARARTYYSLVIERLA